MSAIVDFDKAGTWVVVGEKNSIPRQGSRVIRATGGDIAVFRTLDDKVFALRDSCPHKGGPLSQGIVHGDKVACPLHDWRINLETGMAQTPDEGCAARYPIHVDEDNIVYLNLHPESDAE